MGHPVTGRQGPALALIFLALATGWTPRSASADGAEPEPLHKAFIVSDYRYEPPEGSSANLDIGLSLCGTRCNALSGDFASYLKPGGWRMVKTSGNIEVRVELNNPFLAGQCVCVGDEYKIDWYDPATYLDRPESLAPVAE